MFNFQIGARTTWVGFALAAYGVYLALTTRGADGVREIGEGLGLVFLRAALPPSS